MTKEEAIRAMLDGKKVRQKGWGKGEYCMYNSTKGNPFRYIDVKYDCDEDMDGAFRYNEWEIVEEPKKRQMTRNEVLGFLANTSGIVVRYKKHLWKIHSGYAFDVDEIECYEYAYIDSKGNIGEPMKFEVVE